MSEPNDTSETPTADDLTTESAKDIFIPVAKALGELFESILKISEKFPQASSRTWCMEKLFRTHIDKLLQEKDGEKAFTYIKEYARIMRNVRRFQAELMADLAERAIKAATTEVDTACEDYRWLCLITNGPEFSSFVQNRYSRTENDCASNPQIPVQPLKDILLNLKDRFPDL